MSKLKIGFALFILVATIFCLVFLPYARREEISSPALSQVRIEKVSASAEGKKTEYIVMREEKTGDYYAVPVRWVSPLTFEMIGEPVLITGEPMKVGSGH